MTIEDSLSFFENHPKIAQKLQTLYDVGLGYITLGQSATTLSGGEAQRVKLASELYRRITSSSIYILDEPTTGLHTDDVKRLLKVLHRIVDEGATMVVIEHNLDIIKNADHIIDLGPEGGDAGGEIVAIGTPEEIALGEKSYTGQYLKNALKG
jgi:excinuclease ABC subunit A